MNPSDTGSAGAPLAQPFAPTSPPAAGDSASMQDLLQQLSKAVVGQPQVLQQTLVALAPAKARAGSLARPPVKPHAGLSPALAALLAQRA